jgi:hypothetical protein
MKYSNFRIMDPETRDLVGELLAEGARDPSVFMSFVHCWMAFNGWMASVTEKETDADMIKAFASDERLMRAFDRVMADFPAFRESVLRFSSHWPVLNVKDARKKVGREAALQLDAEQYRNLCLQKKVKQQPAAWQVGIEPSWEQLLRVVYQVRCNLFHGTKSPTNFRDRELVVSSNQIVRQFLAETRCLEWVDEPKERRGRAA